MALDVNKKRQKILEIYPRWTDLYTMEDRRIHAIYDRMRENGRFDPRYKKHTAKKPGGNYQYNILDYFGPDVLPKH